MSDKLYLGLSASSVERGEALPPISRVTVWYDDEGAFTAGDDTGRTLELDCPWATQAMADNLLASLKGYVYQPFTAGDALLDPAAELGDGVTIAGTYSVLAQADTTHDALSPSAIGAPGEEELDHEYPYRSAQSREMARKVALGQSYFGAKITRRNGLVIEKTDGETVSARAVLNADELSFYDAENQRVLYFDPAAGTYRFTGALNVADKFIVDPAGNVTMGGTLTLTGESKWLQTRYSTDREAAVPGGWQEEWDEAWDNTSTQVWAIYSYNGGTDWTQPMLVQGKDGDRGPAGPSGPAGSDANIPAWVEAYTDSAQFDTLVTDQWVVSMNLYGSKIFGGEIYAMEGGDSFASMAGDGFRIFVDGIDSPKVQMVKQGTGDVIQIIMGAGSSSEDPELERFYITKGQGTAEVRYKGPYGDESGFTFHSDGTMDVIGTLSGVHLTFT